jgi:hypothetical protein
MGDPSQLDLAERQLNQLLDRSRFRWSPWQETQT